MQDLNLASCSRADDAGLAHLLPHLPGLTSLVLRNCEALRDASMAAVAAFSKRLVVLDVRHCPGITPKCLPALATLPRLKTFEHGGSGLDCHAAYLASQQTWRHLTPSPPRTRPWWMSHPPAHQPLSTQLSADSRRSPLLPAAGSALSGHVAGPSRVQQHNCDLACTRAHAHCEYTAQGDVSGTLSGGQHQESAGRGKLGDWPAGSSTAAPYAEVAMDSDEESCSSSRSSMSCESLPSLLASGEGVHSQHHVGNFKAP